MKGQSVAERFQEKGSGARFLPILVLLGVVAAGGVPATPANAAHFDNTVSDLASICYDCHTLNANLADDNTSFINASSRTLPTMRQKNGGVTPPTFGCTYCHNDPTRTSTMEDAFSPFNARPSQHPVDRGYARDAYSNLTLGANTFTTLYLSNWDKSFARPADQVDCVDCHDANANGGAYPNHPAPGTGSRAPAANPFMLRNTAAMDNGHAPASFCLQTCHTGTAPGTSGYRMGHYGWGAYDNAGTLRTIKEHGGTPLKTSKCVDCHETHGSNKSSLFGEQKQSLQNVDPVNCAAICHDDTPFRTAGHGRTGTGAPNLQCSNCHNSGVSHRDPANPRRLGGAEASPPATPLLMNAAGNGLDDDFDGVIDNPAEAALQRGGQSICGPCHSNKFNHGGPVAGNTSSSSGKVTGCLYCHEPHASGIGSNVRMVRRTLNGATVNYLTDKADYFRADNTGVCSNVACHGVALSTIMANVSDHATLPNGGVGADCSGCHAHSAAAGSTTGSFAPVCNSCHSYPGQTVVAGTHVLSSVHDIHAIPDAGGGYGFGCQVCHLGNSHNQSNVAPGGPWNVPNGNVNIKFSGDWNPKNANGPSYNGVAADNTLPSGTYAPGVGGNGTCAGLYCHGRSDAARLWSGATADPAWNNPSSAACGTCHRATTAAAPSTFAHAKHADNTAVGYGFGCQVCHYATTTTGTSIANRVEHVNRQSRVSFNPSDTFTGGGFYAGNPATVGTADPSMACTNLYCHSPGNRLTGPFDNGALGAPTWNQGPLACNACHGAAGQAGISVGMPAYPNGTPKANSHPKHLADKFACQVCHYNTTRDGATIFTRSIHVDGVHNAQNDNVAGHAFTYSTSARTCSAAACHGGHNSGPGLPVWGQSTGIPFGCDVCHMNVNGSPAVADVDQFVYDSGMSKISADQWNGTTNGSGHGRTLAYPSGNPGAGTRFPTCTSSCHVTQVGHDNAVNPFRLRSYSGVADFSDANRDPGAQQDDNRICLDCHSASGANPVKATRLVEQNHYGGKHAAGTAGGTFCVDCHDPHGDANHYMVQDNVSRTTDGVYGIPVTVARATFSKANLDGAAGLDTVYDWGDYVKSTDPKTGICQACHSAPPTGALYFYSATGASGFDGTHNKSGSPPQRCTVCHTHNADFSPSCNSCHGVGTSGTGAPPNAPYQNTANLWGAGIDRLGAPAGQGLHRAADNNVLTDHETLACQECHTNTPGSGGEHDNAANVNAVMTNLTARKWTDNVLSTAFLPRTAGKTASVVDDSCNNVNCHSPYGAYQGTAPSGTPFPYERYWENQNLWDCYTCHGYRDAADATNNPGALDRRVSTGSHDRHIRTLANGGMNHDCSMCHETGNAAKYSAASPPGTHKGGFVDWNFAGSPNPYNVAAASRTYSGTQLGGTAAPTDNNTARGHRAYGACANLYCHSIGQTATGGALTGTAGQYLSPSWGNPGTGRCGACHGGDGVNDNVSSVIASGSHGKHAGTAGALRYACSVCHNGLGRGAATHADNGIHLAFGTTLNGTTVNATYSQGNAHPVGNGFGSCTANYCHGTGTPALTGGANQLGTPNVPAWGTPGTSLCGSCHGAPGASTNYPGASNYPTSGAHARHVLDLSGPRMAVCSDCHAADTLSSHVDGKVDFRTAFDNTAATTLALTRTCDPCHGTGVAAAKANWSSVAALDCLTCHGATPSYSFANATGRIAPNVAGDNSSYGSNVKGHNRPTARGPYEISNNPAANQPCNACHDIASLHVDNVDGTTYAGNRLAASVNGTPVADNLVSTLCKACHATAGASPATKKGINAHGNTGYAQRLETATFALECAQCHEPHGMVNVPAAPAGVNIWMINPTVTVRTAPSLVTVSPVRLYGKTGANSFNDFVPAGGAADNNNAAAYSGTDDLCVVCHANAQNPNFPTTYNVAGIHNAPAYKGNEAGKDCSTCHGHNQDGNLATVDGLMPLQCNGCHSYPGLDNTAPNLHQLSAAHNEHVGSPPPVGTANSREYDCTTCHLNYNHNQAQVKAPLGATTWTDCVTPAFINVNFDTAINKRNANGPTYGGALATGASTAPGTTPPGTGSCAGLYCHGNSGADTFATGARDQATWGGANPTPAWNGAVVCGACHRADSTMPQGNHPAHLSAAYGPGVAAFSAAGRCAEGAGCHTSYGLSLTTTHANGQPTFRTSAVDNAGVGLALSGICANCHSATASSGGVGNDLVRNRTNWDNAAFRVPCITCHNNGVQATANLDGTGNKATNIDLAWTLNGHGAAGVPPAGIDNASTTTDAGAVDQVPPVRCETCHDELAGHIGAAKTAINGTNPWRLDNALTRFAQVGGLDNYCLGQCHSQTAKPPRHARIVNGAFAQAKDNTLHTHPTATAVVGTGLAAWYQIPTGDIPLEDDLATKTPPARTGASLVACVSCHDPHGVGTALVPGRTFSGVNTMGAGTQSMLRYNPTSATSPTPLCAKCHK